MIGTIYAKEIKKGICMHRPFRMATKLEIEKNGAPFLNAKRIELLKLILVKGSILSASKALRMSYQQAWTLIQDINSTAPLPVVTRQRGGANGGGAVVTSFGLQLMERYEAIQARYKQFLRDVDEDIQQICAF
jgi:molybdate transport system regulatory protein